MCREIISQNFGTTHHIKQKDPGLLTETWIKQGKSNRTFVHALCYSRGKSAAINAIHLLGRRNFHPAKNAAVRKYQPRPSVSDVAISMPTASVVVGMDTTAPNQLPDLGHSLMGRQSGQAAPQARNYHWIAAWQVLSSACTNLNI